MRILATNDDGIMAPGLAALRRALDPLGDVTVVAPMGPQSAVGHSISLNQPIWCHHIEMAGGVKGHGVEGSPADCVKLALLELMKAGKPDLVVSGVNLGANIGINILYSGTVAAAIEAAFCGIPAVAVSLEASDDPDFDGAARIGAAVARQFMEHQPNSVTLLNVNVPNGKNGFSGELHLVPQSMKGWKEFYERRPDHSGRTAFWIDGAQEPEDPHTETDVSAIDAGHVTVTPLQWDLTDHQRMAEVRDWGLQL